MLPAGLKQKGTWLKKTVHQNRYYEDPELTLSSLGEKLGLHTHELSRMLNSVLKKSFNDFINEYRVRDVIRKMQDPAYDNITLLGIAYDSGFNSQSTFHRIFKELTGKTPAEYKKELPTYNLRAGSQPAAVISIHETTPKWSIEKLNRSFMFRNYLKIAFRNLRKNSLYSLINIGGLAIGMTVSFMLFTYVYNEFSFDKFNVNSDKLYHVLRTQPSNGELMTSWETPIPLAPAMIKDFPEIDKVARTNWTNHILINYKNKALKVPTMAADPAFLDMFTYQFI